MLATLTRTDSANGFANRFLFAMIRRSKLLPFGGNLADADLQHLGERLKVAIDRAKEIGRVQMTPAARRLWENVYTALSEGQPGLVGAITARAEAQTVRLALLYALLDGKSEIDAPHLNAALALWEFCEASAIYIFGDALGDPIADDILRNGQGPRRAQGAGVWRSADRGLARDGGAPWVSTSTSPAEPKRGALTT